jgi:hypothetical protein
MANAVQIAILCFKTTPDPAENLATVETYIIRKGEGSAVGFSS